MTNNLLERVLKTVRNYDMLKPQDRVLAAVSGGPDSVFLLYALHRLRSKLGLRKLIVCNLDHGIRGRESKEDSLFVKNLAAKLGLEFIHKRINLKRRKAKGISTEELARLERYGFFRASAAKKNANVIATGHTLDDQAETVLMRFIKGSSMKGVLGVAPVRKEGGILVVRPLLELGRGEIKNFLDEENISYRIDRTNLEPIYFRNIVRHEIMPFLERYNPRLKRVIFNLAEHLREDFQFIEEAKAESRRIIRSKGGAVELKLAEVIIQPKALQKEILRDSLARAGGEIKKLSFRHWKEVEGLIKFKRKGSAVDLPGGIRATRTEHSLILRRI